MITSPTILYPLQVTGLSLKGQVPQERNLLNVSLLTLLLDMVTFSNHLLLVLTEAAAWRWLAATDFWTHFTRYNSHSLLSFWLGVHCHCAYSQFILVSCALSVFLPVSSWVLLSQCISFFFVLLLQTLRHSLWVYEGFQPSRAGKKAGPSILFSNTVL